MALTLELKSIDNPEYRIKANIEPLSCDTVDIRSVLYNLFKTMTDAQQNFNLYVTLNERNRQEEAYFRVNVDEDKLWWKATEIMGRFAEIPREPQNVIEASLASLIYSRFIE